MQEKKKSDTGMQGCKSPIDHWVADFDVRFAGMGIKDPDETSSYAQDDG